MKKTITSIVVAFMFLSVTANAQKSNIIKDAGGNYTQVSKSNEASVNTGKTFTDSKGNVYPVMKSGKGRLFVIRTSKKTNKEYKQYLDI